MEPSDTSSWISRTEGDGVETVRISTTSSNNGPTINVTATNNSYNSGDPALDTVMGYGWTHPYNIFLFSQLGSMFRFDGIGRITRYKLGPGGTFVAPNGYFETLVKNSGNTFTLTLKDKTMFHFAQIPGTPFLVAGPVWQLTSIVDRNGNTTALAYTNGLLSSLTDTYGRVTTFTYNPNKHLASETDPDGRITTFQYDATGHLLTQITDPLGNSIQYTYNFLFQLTSKTDKAGRTFSYSYVNNEPVAISDSKNTARATLSNPNNWAIDPTQRAVNQLRVYLPSTASDTDGRGNVWQYEYDSNAYITRIIAPDGATTNYTYDPATLMVSSKTDADGNTTTYQYDAEGNRIKMTDALGHVTTYTYESVFNMMTSMTDPRGRVTTYTVDPANGNRLRETDPLGQSRKWTYDIHGNILTDTDKNGNTATYQYDAFGNRVQITDPTPLLFVTTMTYDAVGNMLSRTDPNLHTTTYEYDGLNRLIVETDPLNHTTQTFYDGESNRIQVIDRDGHSTFWQYDQRQRLVKMTDALGNSETYSYDGVDNRVSLTDRNGHTTGYAYDVQNRLNQIIDALGDTSSDTYDGVGNMLTMTDANGHTTVYTYDPLNRRASMTDAASELTTYQYDTGMLSGCPLCGATPGSSLTTGIIDPDGNAHTHSGVTYYKYDALDRQIDLVRKVGSTADTIVPATDAVTTTTYDPVGNRLTVTEPDGDTTTSSYDADNRMTTQVNAAGDTSIKTYDGVGNVITVTAPNLNVTTDSYDALDRLAKVTDSAGAVLINTYDPVGNSLSYTDGNGNTTSHSYDAINRLVTTTDPLGKVTTTVYDPVGNPLQSTDRNGNITMWSYDAINRRIDMTDALSNMTQWQYDPVGNLIRLTDANGHSTRYSFDPVNRPVTETYPDGLSRSYGYDGVGNLLTRTDQIGQNTQYAYSDLYFLLSRTYPSAVNDSFTYDLSGRMLTAQRGTWPNAFTYDGANRITLATQNGQTVSYVYNIPGRTRTLTYPGGRVVTEHTDARTRMDHIDDAGSPPSIVQYSYDPGNRVTNRAYRNSTAAAFSYNANNWILNLQHSVGVTPIAGFSYIYDNEGNKQFENKLQNATRSEAYQYDSIYRLIDYKVGTLVGSTVPVPNTETSYNLDPVGNWNSKTTDAVTQNRTHNADNELVEIDTQALTYDADGNTQNDGSFTYAYDEENRLTTVTRKLDSAVVGQYQYDVLNRRVQEIANPAGTASTTQYFYDSARVVEEQNGTGMTQATYVYGNYIDEILTMDRSGQIYYYHENALWSVEAITDSTSAPVERYSYDAYGYLTVTNGAGTPVPQNAWGTPHSAIGSPWTFTGRQLDEEAGLYYYRARHYDAGKGRFLQRDRLTYRGGMNLYEYVNDQPVKYLDPMGLCYCPGCPSPENLAGKFCTIDTTTSCTTPCADSWYNRKGKCCAYNCTQTYKWKCVYTSFYPKIGGFWGLFSGGEGKEGTYAANGSSMSGCEAPPPPKPRDAGDALDDKARKFAKANGLNWDNPADRVKAQSATALGAGEWGGMTVPEAIGEIGDIANHGGPTPGVEGSGLEKAAAEVAKELIK